MVTENSAPVSYSREEREKLVELVLGLAAAKIQSFLAWAQLSTSGIKKHFRERIEAALGERHLTEHELIDLLDYAVPWQRHHVYPLRGLGGDRSPWMDPQRLRRRLRQRRLSHLLNGKQHLLLPADLTISQIFVDETRLGILAVKRQEWADRREALDRIEKTEDGKEIEWRAFERYVDRSLARFEWNFETDTAMLQVSECGKRGNKGALTEAVSSFKELVEPWLPIDTLFSPIDLPRAIARLHEGEETGRREIRYVAIDYTVAGRRVTGRSSSRLDPLLGEKAVDLALHDMRRAGTAQGGNFYWLPRPGTPFDGEIHTHIAGEEGWVYFPADHQTEDCVRYIIGRLRALAE